MSDLKKIGRRRILQALADALQIEGVSQRAPIVMDTSRLVPTVNLEPGLMAYEAWQSTNLAPIPIAGLASMRWVLVGNEAGAVLFDPHRQLDNANREYVIMGIRILVRYDAAGAAADAGDINSVLHDRQLVPGANLGFQTTAEMGIVDGAVRLFYSYTFPQMLTYPVASGGFTRPAAVSGTPIWVPAGSVFGMTLSKISGAAWPANTVANISAWGVRGPRGMRLPGM